MSVFSAREATISDIPLIRELTLRIWPMTYSPILFPEQIDYMLHLMYSPSSLSDQMHRSGHEFVILRQFSESAGFASYNHQEAAIFRLNKLYILPELQGKGAGRFLLDEVIHRAKARGGQVLELNVNRHNPALSFYHHLGFTIFREENIDIGNGYFMNDYVMRKML
jgi:diamine N-acetyltransferase